MDRDDNARPRRMQFAAGHIRAINSILGLGCRERRLRPEPVEKPKSPSPEPGPQALPESSSVRNIPDDGRLRYDDEELRHYVEFEEPEPEPEPEPDDTAEQQYQTHENQEYEEIEIYESKEEETPDEDMADFDRDISSSFDESVQSPHGRRYFIPLRYRLSATSQHERGRQSPDTPRPVQHAVTLACIAVDSRNRRSRSPSSLKYGARRARTTRKRMRSASPRSEYRTPSPRQPVYRRTHRSPSPSPPRNAAKRARREGTAAPKQPVYVSPGIHHTPPAQTRTFATPPSVRTPIPLPPKPNSPRPDTPPEVNSPYHARPRSPSPSPTDFPSASPEYSPGLYLPYADETVPLLYSTHIDHNSCQNLMPSISLKLAAHALELIQRGLSAHTFDLPCMTTLLRRDPNAQRSDPPYIISDVDLHLGEDAIYVASERGPITTADYLDIVGVPETRKVVLRGVVPAWAKKVFAGAESRLVPEAYQPKAPEELPLPGSSVVEVYWRGLGSGDEGEEWALGKLADQGRVGIFPWNVTEPVGPYREGFELSSDCKNTYYDKAGFEKEFGKSHDGMGEDSENGDPFGADDEESDVDGSEVSEEDVDDAESDFSDNAHADNDSSVSDISPNSLETNLSEMRWNLAALEAEAASLRRDRDTILGHLHGRNNCVKRTPWERIARLEEHVSLQALEEEITRAVLEMSGAAEDQAENEVDYETGHPHEVVDEESALEEPDDGLDPNTSEVTAAAAAPLARDASGRLMTTWNLNGQRC